MFGQNTVTKQEGKVDYMVYRLSLQQWSAASMAGMVGASGLMMIFYRNIWIILAAGAAGAILFPKIRKTQLIQKRQQQLQLEFKEALYSLIVSLRAGRSMEGAFAASLEDLDPVITPHIYREWEEIVKQLQVGFSVEDSLEDFAQRSGVEEIQSFARTIEICKRSEGDVTRVMENTIHLLQERMEIQMELKILLTKKKTEQKILNLMPFAVIGLLLMMSPDYLSPLYECLQGQLIMTACVGLTLLSYILSKKIADISL